MESTHSPILKVVPCEFKRKRWNCDGQDDVFSGNRILELCPESGFEVVVLDPPWESKSRGLVMGVAEGSEGGEEMSRV